MGWGFGVLQIHRRVIVHVVIAVVVMPFGCNVILLDLYRPTVSRIVSSISRWRHWVSLSVIGMSR